MLGLMITSYKLTLNMSSYLQEYIKYPVDYAYNKTFLTEVLKTVFFWKKLTNQRLEVFK